MASASHQSRTPDSIIWAFAGLLACLTPAALALELQLTLDATEVDEHTATALMLEVGLDEVLENDLEVTLSVSDPTQLSLAPTVVIPASQSSTTIELSVVNDPYIEDDTELTISAQAPGAESGAINLTVLDDDVPERMTIGGPFAGPIDAAVYVIVSNWQVPEGGTLEVQPGTEFRFDDDIFVQVFGSLTAVGASEAPIVFTSSSANPVAGQWSGINLFGDSVLSNTIVEYSSAGIQVFDGDAPPRFELTDSVLRFNEGTALSLRDRLDTDSGLVLRNTVEDNGAGIAAIATASGCDSEFISARIENNHVRNNQGSGIALIGGGSSFRGCIPSRRGTVEATVNANIVTGNEVGILIAASKADFSGGNRGAVFATVTNNLVRNGNSDGIRATNDNGVIEFGVINNTIVGNNGFGVLHTDDVSTESVIRNNIIVANASGIGATATFEPPVASVSNNNVFAQTGDNWLNYPESFGTLSGSNAQGTPVDAQGNFSADPMFFGEEDFRLMSASPAVDAGSSDQAPDLDFEGDIRVMPGVDVGFDEQANGCNAIVSPSVADTDADQIVDFCDTDDDGDAMPDEYETANGLDPLVDDALADLDADGFSNLYEFRVGTDPNDANSFPEPTLTPSLLASVLPTSRSATVGQTVTVFVTLINTSAAVANNCSLSPLGSIPASFEFNQTNTQNGVVAGTTDQLVSIDPGASATFVISIQPSAAFAAREVEFGFRCDETGVARSTAGLNTLLLSSSEDPVPDLVALSATVSGDGVARLVDGIGAFAVASVNVGSAGTLTVRPELTQALPVGMTICQTDPGTGACIGGATPLESVTVDVSAGATLSFGVFLQTGEAVVFDPETTRVLVYFEDATGVIRGSTSVAVTTE